MRKFQVAFLNIERKIINFKKNKTKIMREKTKIINQALDNDKSINFLNNYGFKITKKDKETITLKKPGTTITLSGENMPKELTINYRANSTEITLKYDAFVLFDTGDLEEELDRIYQGLTQNELN